MPAVPHNISFRPVSQRFLAQSCDLTTREVAQWWTVLKDLVWEGNVIPFVAPCGMIVARRTFYGGLTSTLDRR
ncbi:hypothetical protein BV22DRAFT_1036743 [Leucogyrophana mollusca]|uniref:Uncharacterized protein n=1 Tax=Leucogyrophana mollusca TaxID=85980 RepID=A0ACB8BE09_9AGAM|nr:hypothetical protein BV22DRAFT_1036743 [Leucogyrophana mollusca]